MKLTTSLQEAGVEAWTPMEHVRRRVPRGKAKEYVSAPLTPTYVFVREAHLADMKRIEKEAGSPHPQFSIFRYYGSTVFLPHKALHGLRQLQQDSYIASLPNAPRHAKKPRGDAYEAGDTLKLLTGAFAGMEGMVEDSDGLVTTVLLTLFGRSAGVQIPTVQLRADGVAPAYIAA